MKKINLIEWLSRNSHEKQSPQRFGRYAVMLLMLLTLGVTRAWATPTEGSTWRSTSSASNAHVYFDNTNSSYPYVSMLIGRQWDYGGASNPVGSWGVNFSLISGTNNLYYKNVQENKYTTFCFINKTNWGWEENNTVTSRLGYCTNTDTPNDDLGTSTHLYVPASGEDGASVTHTTPASYTALNYTQTLYQCVSENGGTPAKSTTSIGTISIATKYLSSASSTSNHNASISSGNNSCNTTAARTATVTMTATSITSGYTFLGWYDSETGGTRLENSTTYTYQATGAKTVYARFSHETTHSVTIYYKCGSTNVTSQTSQAIGQVTASSITAPTVYGYTFTSWTLNTGISNQSASTSANPISVKTLSSGTYNMTANYTEDLSSTWYVSGKSTAIFGGWGSSGKNMQRKTGYSTKKTFYYTIDATKVINGSTSDSDLEFKIYNSDGDSYRGNSGYWVTRDNYQPTLSSSSGDNMQFRPDAYGTYEFKVDCESPYSESAPKLTVTFGTKRQVNFGKRTGCNTVTAKYKNSVSMTSGQYVIDGSSVTFSQTPLTGYTFEGWYNASSGGTRQSTSSTYTVTVSGGTKTIYPNYTINNHNITRTSPTNGTYTIKVGSAAAVSTNTTSDYGKTITLAATPNTGYYLSGWTVTKTGDASTVVTVTNNTFTMPDYDVTVTATFANQWGLYSSINSWGTPTALGNYSTSASKDYGYIEVSLAANTQYSFKIRDFSTSANYKPSTNTEITYVNKATAQTMSSTASGEPNQTIMTAAAGTYHFTWNITDKTITVTYPTSYKVTFGKGTGGATLTASASTTGSITTGKYVGAGENITFTQTANTGYTFTGWYDASTGGSAVPTMGVSDNILNSIAADATVYSRYSENMSTITVSAGTGGTVTTGSGEHSLGVTTTQAINASASTGYTWSTWTTTGNARLVSSATTASNTAKADGTVDGSGTIVATFTPNHYNVTLKLNGGTGTDNQVVDAVYDAAMPTVIKTAGTAIAIPTRTGYTFDGYRDGESSGTKYYNYTSSTLSSARTWDKTSATDLYAKWDANTHTVSLDYDETNHGDITTTPPTGSVTATYDAAMPAIAKLPKAAEGYAFMGYFSSTGGGGTQYYDGTGASVTNWNVDDDITLYAYYKKAEITALTLDAAIVETNGTVGVTPTVSPTPTGNTKLCFYVFHSNGNPLSPQPEISWNGTKATFDAGAVSGTYKVGVSLRTGTACGGGTLLDSSVVEYQVAGIHDVTVRYKCGDDVIASASTTTGRPLDWSDEITAPEIFGYTFSSWTAGDGVTLTDDDGANTKTTTTEATIKIKAIYDGYLTANYNQNAIIYFKNTLGWENVYVNFHTGDAWNNADNGSGSPKGVGNSGLTNRNKQMTQIDDTDIWYYDYGAASISPSLYISFTDKSRDGVSEFWAENPGINVVYPANYPDAISTNKSSENGFKAATPMFVPLESQDAKPNNVSSTGKANYYNAGYWTKYTSGTGYTLEIYNSAGNVMLKSVEFTSEDELMPMKAVVDLEAGQTYKYQLRRGGTDSYGIYYGNSGTMTYAEHGAATAWSMTNHPSFSMCGITANAAGDYTFNLSYSANASTEYRLRMAVDYPIASGDYRLVYTDNKPTCKPSAIIPKVNNGKDTVSFFIRPGNSPALKIQTATVNGSTGAITWGSDVNVTSSISSLTKDSVYNICLTMNGSGAISVEKVEAYTGNYYIRVDAANSKWDNYRSDPDHLMTYSEYSITHGGYSHYYTHWVDKDDAGRKNVKFCIANDYSPSISDTLIRESNAVAGWENINNYIDSNGDLKRNANVRFMWNRHDNTISRAYVDGAQEDDSRFLVISSTDGKIKKADGTALSNNEVTFSDDENWIYEANVKAQSGALIKLKSIWGESNTIEQYFKGSSSTTEALIGGSGENWYDIRILYDFKTNRLIASYVPVDENITSERTLEADIMFIREHQGDIAQLTFGESGKISKIETAYGVMRFNKWTLANKDKSAHTPLGSPASIYERSLYWISFPFKVKLSEVIGFGTYGVHWAIQRYDGKDRAERGHFLENGSFWKWMNRNTDYLEPDQGYLLAIDLDLLGESSDVWGPESRSDQIELYFPSYGTMPDITNANVEQTLTAHECTINRAATEGLPDTGDPRTSYNRTIFDSHWNVMSVPTYVNTDDVSFTNDTWIAEVGPNFLYTWNADDNTITATSASGYTYHAMHAYMVQYEGDITWSASSGSPASIVARRTYAEKPSKVEFRLELQQNEKMIDRTYVALSNDEEVSTGFKFGEDLTKEFNANKSCIYTFIADEATVAGNTLPMSNQTTIVPVGVDIKKNGDYTFSIPDGTSSIGVTLIDNETGIRTSLSALDYTVNLSAGTYDNRFVLEISPIKPIATGVEQSQMTNDQSPIKKVMIDGLLYIVKDGKMFDARGAIVK